MGLAHILAGKSYWMFLTRSHRKIAVMIKKTEGTRKTEKSISQ